MKRGKEVIIFISILILLIIPLISAGLFSNVWDKITGKATQPITVNVTIGIPEIRNIYNDTSPSITAAATGLSAGPGNTSIIINFSVYLGAGVGNLNNASATINFSKSGESLRQNSSCYQYEAGTNTANYTCNITMMWFDGAGTWSIEAFINDTNGNAGSNKSTNFSVGETTGFETGSITWPAISPGQTNRTSAVNLTLNNTGNKIIPVNATQINATNLRGETTSTVAIWAGNISVNWDATGLASCISTGGNETKATNLTAGHLVNISMANLSRGNFTINDGNTGQEIYYFCIKLAGSDLTSQSYSTANEGPWTVKIL